jgi:hypothetical protein
MFEKIMIDMLTKDSVSIARQKYITIEEIEYAIGDNIRCAYINTERGRNKLAAELNDPFLSAVMTVWGDTPTVIEEITDEESSPNQNEEL